MSPANTLRNGIYAMQAKRRGLKSATKTNPDPKLSRTHAPADLSPVEWQRGLRRQFGREQAFGLENLSTPAAAAGDRATTCRRAFGARGWITRQGRMTLRTIERE